MDKILALVRPFMKRELYEMVNYIAHLPCTRSSAINANFYKLDSDQILAIWQRVMANHILP